MIKMTWNTPELIVIVRRRPEEAVLGNCKTHVIDTGPHTDAGVFGYSCMGDNQQGAGSLPACAGHSNS